MNKIMIGQFLLINLCGALFFWSMVTDKLDKHPFIKGMLRVSFGGFALLFAIDLIMEFIK